MLYSGDKTAFSTNVNPLNAHTLELIRFLDRLGSLTTDLYLTGSRYFGGVTNQSDWDFFCGKLSDDQEKELFDLGFKVQYDKTIGETPIALFGGTQRVFCFVLDDAAHSDFHILEVDHIGFRLKTQAIIKEFFPSGYSDKKHNAKSVWDMAESVVMLKLALNKLLNVTSDLNVTLYTAQSSSSEQDYPDSYLNMMGGDEPGYDEENDWEDCFEWMMEHPNAKPMLHNLSSINKIV